MKVTVDVDESRVARWLTRGLQALLLAGSSGLGIDLLTSRWTPAPEAPTEQEVRRGKLLRVEWGRRSAPKGVGAPPVTPGRGDRKRIEDGRR